MLNREKIHELVRLFYHPTYKTFYINSLDEKEVTKPLGVFVSLGMTTAWDTLENIRDLLGGTYKAEVVEISSKRIGDQFVNTIINRTDPKQFRLEDIPSDVMTKEECEKEYERLMRLMDPERSPKEVLAENAHKFQKLRHLMDRLESTNGWDSHLIQKDGDRDYRIYHLLVNYMKVEGTEYRIGIFVSDEKDSV